MDGDRKYPPQSYKVKVVQEYEVYLYFQEGIYAEDDEELHDIISEEAMCAAFGEDGLTAVLHEQTETENGYLAHVTTLETHSEVVYNYKGIPEIISQELKRQGLT